MGSCASVDKSRPRPAIKLMAFGTRADSLVIPKSPRKENSGPVATTPAMAAEDGDAAVKSRWSFSSAEKSLESPRKDNSVPGDTPTAAEVRPVKYRWSFSSAKKSFGSKEETFFDSQPWLESDDEFHSVNGDFTPSRGNTPKSSFSERLPRMHNLLYEERPPNVSPAPLLRRKKLAELFRDSIREEYEDSAEDSPENQSEASKRSDCTAPYVSRANSDVCSNELKAIENSVSEKEKSLSSGYRCLPGFGSCGSSSGKRKKMSPVAVAVK
ncbi:PREDICTED: uncharacterized protein At3g27210-like [Tarenaya hassleriana]|uniref:uncharacterized protein At3g27210-like n=1 Tax=Tarenaya hassleriana TaxID=28532 RepID=UPI00053C2A6D|nr:PREDICTED: uncharacterized protein At3g27210-like [Tarenaya hassleriana]